MSESVWAVLGGIVMRVGDASDGSPYGTRVYIRHDSGEVTMYAHLESCCVFPKQIIRDCETIGIMGSSGAKEKHLHLSYFKLGVREYTSRYTSDPAPFIAAHFMPCNTKATNPYGSTEHHPAVPFHEGIDFSGWDKIATDGKPTAGLVVNAQYEKLYKTRVAQ